MTPSLPDRISTIAELEAVYGPPLPRALDKELDHISGFYRAFIERAPFVVLATVGPEGTDCSPRGDPPGFVRVADPHTVMLPDRRGNNRIDSLRNIVRDPRVSLLFLVPGVGETLRINGTAQIVTDTDLCQSFAMAEKAPRSVIVVGVGSVYYQCQKALVRSRLWDPASIVPRHELPSAGQMLQAMLDVPGFSGDAYDRNYPEHMKQTIY